MPPDSRCPHCDSEMEPGAVVCIECGYNAKTGRQLKTRSKRVRFDFGSSPRTPWRLYPAIGLTALGCVLFIGAAVLSRTDERHHGGVGFGIVMGLFLLLSPLLGCGSTVSVTRNKRGEAILVKHTWICFYPLKARTIHLDDWEAMYFEYWPEGNIRGDSPRYGLKLGRDRRGKFFTVYHGGDEERMKDIADAIKELTGMPFERM